ncbi:MAG TPA: trypsin-like peptidase domain-containing protein [Vicinamibacteria bacterium]|jgi:serine protease Do
MKTGAAFTLMIATWTLPAVGAQRDALDRLREVSGAFEALAERVNPAVVQVFSTAYVPGQGLVGSTGLILNQRSMGSGVILDPDGYIVTNAHVVAGARRVQVMLATKADDLPDGASILQPRGKLIGAQLVGIDRETDLAVLKANETGLPFLEFGDSDELRPGQLVFAFGSPLGLENSVSTGVVSATARQLRPEDPMIYVQTDAPINPGNSGGPLVDARGLLVGINTLILSQSGGSEGLGFAAPSNIVRNVYDQIRKTGRVRRGEIGVRAQTISPALARGLDLPREWGVVLSDVYPGGPADQAGLRIGDVVLALDGKTMENGRQFQVNLYRRAVGETAVLQVQRGAEISEYAVRIVERPDDPDRFRDMVSPDTNLVEELGILAIDYSPAIASKLLGLRKRSGVVVAARSVEGVNYEAEGLLPGDVIHAVNRLPVASMSELRASLVRLRSGDPIVLQVNRRGELRYVSVIVE